MLPLLTNQDEMKHEWLTDNGSLIGLGVFNISIIKGIGGFDEKYTGPFDPLSELSFRVKSAGRITYYISSQSACDLNAEAYTKQDYEVFELHQKDILNEKRIRIPIN